MSFLGGKNSRASFYRYKQRERSEGVLVQNNLEGPIEAVQPNQAVQPAEALRQIEDEVQIDYFEMGDEMGEESAVLQPSFAISGADLSSQTYPQPNQVNLQFTIRIGAD